MRENMAKVVDLSRFSAYKGKFVARIDDELVEYGDSLEELLEKLRRKGIDPRKVLIDYVPEEPVYYLI